MSFFGKNLKKIRKLKSLSQKELADSMGLKRAALGAYEEGRSEPKIDTIIRFANYIGISIDSLLQRELSVNELLNFNTELTTDESKLRKSFPKTPFITKEFVADYTQTVKQYLVELDYTISLEKEDEGILVIQKEEYGIKNLVVGIAPPVLIMEQYIFKIENPTEEILKNLLMKNRDIIHGAFVLDETGQKVIFRDTLQIDTLDIEELEASLNSLSLLMSEYAEDIIKFSRY